MRCAVNVLGPLQIVVGDVDVTPRAPKERSLLALLAMHPGRVVSTDRLIDELWPDLTIDRARRVLWVRLAALRASFRSAGTASLLESVPPGYRLTVEPEAIDAERFAALVVEAGQQRDRGDHRTAARTLRAALALRRGDPLVDAQGCLALEAEASRLADGLLDALEEWVDAELACGRHGAVLPEVRRYVAEHPLRERLASQLVTCLERAGRVPEAVAACRDHRARLAAELGMDTGLELEALERQLVARRSDRGGAAVPHDLPVPPTGFVGRRGELAELAALLRDHRMITLTGVGGVGKTRLAIETARAALDRQPAGAWLVELAPLRDDAAVAPAVAAAVGLALVDHADPAQRLAEHLAGQRVLLVLDNAEHVVGGVAALVHQLARGCPELSVLVTSRQALHVAGEVVYAVPPMAIEPAAGLAAPADALALFLERARASRPGVPLGANELAAAASVCRRLDGIPLAIELAAARVRMLSVDQIAARLDHCFPVLTGGASCGVPDRHVTMRAALDWSHDLLPDAERLALRRLAVFPGDFDVDAAVAVVEGGGVLPPPECDGFTLVSQLVDRSLVEVVADGTRMRLLAPIRQYAAERLVAAGEVMPARRAHRDVYLRRDDPMWPLMSAQQRRRTYADRENLLAALEWSWRVGDDAAALQLVAIQATSWMCAGDSEGRRWLERVLAVPEPAVHPARVRALLSLAQTLHDSGAHDQRVDDLLLEAAALAERLDDPVERASCTLTRVEQAIAGHDIAAAQRLTLDAMRVYEDIGAAGGLGWCQHYLGWIAMAEDDHERARVHFQRSIELAREDPGGEWLLPHALAALAPLTAALGDADRALALAGEAVAAARPFAVRAVLAMALARAAEARILAGDDGAAGDLVELLRLLQELGTRRWLADALEMGAVVLARRGAHDAAGTALGASEALRAGSGEPDGGVRVVAPEVRASVEVITAALGPAGLATARRRGRRLTPDAASAHLLNQLA